VRSWFVALTTAAVAIAMAASGIAANGPAAAGIAISNVATATYQDANGATYSGLSNEVLASVQAVGALAVSPKETSPNGVTEAAAVNSTTVRTFTISNVSNIKDAYTITSASAGAQSILSVAFVNASAQTPVTVGSTVSPVVLPGESITVVLTISTAGMALGAQVPVTITAQTTNTTTSNGLQQDSGQEWIVGAHGARLVGPGGGSSRIMKTVDKTAMVQTSPGATVTFDIAALNAGDAAATNAYVTDTIPSGLTCDPSSVRSNGQTVPLATLTGQTLTVPLGTLAAGASIEVSFTCMVANTQTLGSTFVNIASISADGISQKTTPASVLTGTANVVFDGYAGAGHPVNGAVVTLLDGNGQPVKLTGTSSFAQKLSLGTSSTAANPYITASDGRYGFPLASGDIGAGKRFYLTIGAAGYLHRRIALDIAPGAGDPLYDVSASAQDGQPLAVAGGFTLTSTAVQLKDVFGLFGNLPLFAARNIEVQKTADRSYAQQGDRVVFTIDFSNASSADVGPTGVTDTMPAGLMYARGTATMDGTALEPVQNGQQLVWHLPKLAASEAHRLVYASAILPGVAPGSSLTNAVEVSGLVPGTLVNTTGRSSVSVKVIDGAFSQRIIITGRVFADLHRNGRFTHGDKGLAGVRVYLEDGSAALTDAKGRFSFPGAHPGMHVLRVDPATLPEGYRATPSLQRLVHGLLDDGLMEDVEFPVEAAT